MAAGRRHARAAQPCCPLLIRLPLRPSAPPCASLGVQRCRRWASSTAPPTCWAWCQTRTTPRPPPCPAPWAPGTVRGRAPHRAPPPLLQPPLPLALAAAAAGGSAWASAGCRTRSLALCWPCWWAGCSAGGRGAAAAARAAFWSCTSRHGTPRQSSCGRAASRWIDCGGLSTSVRHFSYLCMCTVEQHSVGWVGGCVSQRLTGGAGVHSEGGDGWTAKGRSAQSGSQGSRHADSSRRHNRQAITRPDVAAQRPRPAAPAAPPRPPQAAPGTHS